MNQAKTIPAYLLELSSGRPGANLTTQNLGLEPGEIQTAEKEMPGYELRGCRVILLSLC